VRPPVLWLSALLVVVIAAWASVTWINSALGSGRCAQRTVLDVAAAPAIAATLSDLVADGAGGQCADVRVSAKDSSSFADALANPPPGEQPQVWIPESTFWLGRAQARGAFEVPAAGTSVASTPVVVAMTEGAAGQYTGLASPERDLAASSDHPFPSTYVGVAARIAFARDHLVADEGGDPFAQLQVLCRQGEVDHEAASVVTGRRSSSAAARENIGSIARANRSQIGSGRRPLRCRCTLRQEIAPSR